MDKATKMDAMSEGAQAVFKKMFDAVGAPHDMDLTEDWYTRYTWTDEEQEAFRDWFVQYHWKGPGKRGKGVLAKHATSKRAVTEAWQWFNLQWGWTIKEEE